MSNIILPTASTVSDYESNILELRFKLVYKKYILIAFQASDNATRLGAAVLDSFGVYTDKNWYWIGTAAILGFAVLFNVLFTFALEYFSRKS